MRCAPGVCGVCMLVCICYLHAGVFRAFTLAIAHVPVLELRAVKRNPRLLLDCIAWADSHACVQSAPEWAAFHPSHPSHIFVLRSPAFFWSCIHDSSPRHTQTKTWKRVMTCLLYCGWLCHSSCLQSSAPHLLHLLQTPWSLRLIIHCNTPSCMLKTWLHMVHVAACALGSGCGVALLLHCDCPPTAVTQSGGCDCLVLQDRVACPEQYAHHT